MKKEVVEEQRMYEGKLVCPGCNTTLAQEEKFAVINDKGFKLHNKRCLTLDSENITRRALIASQAAQAKSTQISA